MCLWNMAAGDRTIVGEIDLRSSIVASRCPMPVITLYVNIPASCSTLNYPLVPSVYPTSICIRFLEPRPEEYDRNSTWHRCRSNLHRVIALSAPCPCFASLTRRFSIFKDLAGDTVTSGLRSPCELSNYGDTRVIALSRKIML